MAPERPARLALFLTEQNRGQLTSRRGRWFSGFGSDMAFQGTFRNEASPSSTLPQEAFRSHADHLLPQARVYFYVLGLIDSFNSFNTDVATTSAWLPSSFLATRISKHELLAAIGCHEYMPIIAKTRYKLVSRT